MQNPLTPEEELLQSIGLSASDTQQEQEEGSQLPADHAYTNFCCFCMQDTMWHGMGNISECQQCHVQGTNYSKQCRNHGPGELAGSSYLFNLENCVPHIEGQPLMAVCEGEKAVFQCFGCCFEAMCGDEVPFRYVYQKQAAVEPELAFCWECQSQTEWLVYAQRRQTIKNSHVVMEDEGNFEDVSQNYQIIKRCSNKHINNTGCTSFKSVVAGILCPECERQTNEIHLSSKEDAKCQTCFETACITKFMMEEARKKHELEQDLKLGEIKADNYKYYCPFCYEITDWKRVDDEYSQCGGCGSQGSVKPGKCVTCLDRLHVYRGDKGGKCAKCVRGLGPKDVVGVKAMPCLFCHNKLNTFYEYGLGTMMCTGCENYRSRLGPHGEVSEQYCESCKSAQPELWRQSTKEQCRNCWKDEFEFEKIQDQAQRARFDLEVLNASLPGAADLPITISQAPQPRQQQGKLNSTDFFKYECPFCGIAEQTWRDLGTGSSQCQGCKTVGTNSWEETCAHCNQEDFIFTVSHISKCFSCWNKE